MSEDQHGDDGTDRHEPSARLVDQDEARWRRWSVLLPALTFLAGVALGAAVLGASTTEDEPRAAPTAPPTPSASPTDVTIRVPGPCLQAAERAEQAYALVERGVTAARDLDARELADLVDEAQRQRPEVQSLVEACRSAATDAVVQPGSEG